MFMQISKIYQTNKTNETLKEIHKPLKEISQQ